MNIPGWNQVWMRVWLVAGTAFLLVGCGLPDSLPLNPELPVQIPDIPGLPRELGDLPAILRDLGLPDLSALPNLPGVELLPESTPGALLLRGPTERSMEIGDSIPGTDIELTAIGEEGAEFRIAGMRSVRILGDSLDYDGEWLGANVGGYHVRLRIYQVGESKVRAAGVHQLEVRDAQPVAGAAGSFAPGAMDTVLAFPYSAVVNVGGTISGATYGFSGQEERGARLTGLPEGDYPFRKMGDSVLWEGTLRPGLQVVYELRLLYYGESQATFGGIARISIAGS